MKSRILVVEDSEDMRLIYKRLFRKEDMKIYETDIGETALEMVSGVNPDLVLVDISLPGMNGLDLTRKLRSLYPEMKILIVTGHETERYYDEAIKAGADDLVSKDIGRKIVDKCKQMIRESNRL